MIQSRHPLIDSPQKNETETTFRSQVRAVLGQLYPDGRVRERRRDNRFPYPELVRLVPCDAAGRMATGDSIVVVGRHLSEGGLGFFHPAPIADRHVIAQLESPAGEPIHLLMDLRWCRFSKEGWYDSGGQFLKLVEQTNLPQGTEIATAS